MESVFYNVELNGTSIRVLKRYKNLKKIGSGAQGDVFSAVDRITGTKVAIKKLTRPFSDVVRAKRAYREFVIMNLVNHQNVIKLLNVFTPQNNLAEFSDIFLVMEYMENNLEYGIENALHHKVISFLLYQMLCGIQHLHKAGIIHRDLKPSNIAINQKCELKILDFGLARSENNTFMTQYVVTRYYRAPEVILGIGYNQNADVWSIGCIFAELLTGRVLFPGTDYVDQWMKIIQVVGTPNSQFISRLQTDVQNYIKSRCYYNPAPWESIFPDSLFPRNLDPELSDIKAENARDLIAKMLVIDPEHRISVSEALRHPYVNMWYDTKEVEAPPADYYNVTVEMSKHSVDEWKALLFQEIMFYQETHNVACQFNS